jgi:hypothetical protein
MHDYKAALDCLTCAVSFAPVGDPPIRKASEFLRIGPQMCGRLYRQNRASGGTVRQVVSDGSYPNGNHNNALISIKENSIYMIYRKDLAF